MSKDENNLSLAVVPQDFLDKMEAEMNQIKALLKAKNESEINFQWIESLEIPKILGVSRKTWQTYRDKRLLPFSQIGSKIYVKRADLEEFMMSNRIKAL
jgi:hypothetical protein